MPSISRAARRPVAVVTGASAGVGRAIAHVLARRGYAIGLLARGRERLDAALAEVRAEGGDGIAVPTDVAVHGEVRAAARRVEEELGPIDVWINDAMVTILAPVHEIRPEEFERITHVTYLGVVWGTMVALEHMRPRDRGHIIQVGSALAHRAIPLQSAYCGAKHAERGFTDSLRSELLHDRSRILLSMAQLPAMNTPQFSWSRARLDHAPQPVPPIFDPHVAARAIVSIIGTRCREIYVGGSSLRAIVGNKIAPGLGDRLLAKAGYEGQQTDEPLDPDRPDNLFDPAPGDFGTTGPFDDRAKHFSLQARSAAAWERLASPLRPRPDFPDEIPPDAASNPAAYSRRLPVALGALVMICIAAYLAMHRAGVVDTVWEPLFGTVPPAPSRGLPLYDAWLVGAVYLLVIPAAVIGDRSRWRTMPWIAVLLALLVGPVGVASVALLVLPYLALGWAPTVCLLASLLCVLMVAPPTAEAVASLRHVWRARRDPPRSVARRFWGLSPEQRTD
ncbi:MAG: SDR family oxidoreductase [Sandaracinaceae bacterium]